MSKRYLTLTLASLLLTAAVALANVALTTPEAVRSEVGSPTTVTYDEIRTIRICVDPQSSTVTAQIELFDPQDAARPAFSGEYRIDAGVGSLAEIEIPRLGFETGVTLTNPQRTSVINNIDAHRDNVESSMISFGLVDGTQQ